MIHVPTMHFAVMPTFHQLWDVCMERHLALSVADLESIFYWQKVTHEARMLDTCSGSGSLDVELLKKGYHLTTADGSPGMLALFRKQLRVHGIAHEPILATWQELPRVFPNTRFDALICSGNSLIYSGGHWNRDGEILREQALADIRETLTIFRGLLTSGGVLLVDKPTDDERTTEELVARLCIAEKEKYDVYFSVRFDGDRRTAQILLRHQVTGEECGTPNVAYRLKDDELVGLLYEAGFESVERMAEGVNSHFPLFVAKA